MTKKIKFGWRPDVPDPRDFSIKDLKMSVAKRLPESIDLRKFCSPVEDQGSIGSCTAQALAGNMELLYRKANLKHIDISRLFVYYEERKAEGTINEDAGAMLRTGIRVLAKRGGAPEAVWPYKIRNWKKKPPRTAYSQAKKHQILKYARIRSLHQLKGCLANGYPVVFGFVVFESCMSAQVAKTGIIPLQKSRDDSVLGGHAVMAVGYDNKRKAILIRNSWGTKWGIKGYGWLPYEYVEDRNLSDDFWTIKAQEM